MPRVTKTIEAWECGACGREGNEDDIFPCEKCGKEICESCGAPLLTLTVKRRARPGTLEAILCGGPRNYQEIFMLQVCEGCMKGVEQALLDVGFKEFSYNVEPV